MVQGGYLGAHLVAAVVASGLFIALPAYANWQTANTVSAASTVPVSPPDPVSASAPTAPDPEAAATAICRTLAVESGTNGPLIFYNSFLQEVGRVAAPKAMKLRIEDCDPYFFYLNAEDVQKVGTFAERYHHGRVAVKRGDVIASALVKPMPVTPLKAPAKPKAVTAKGLKPKAKI